MLLEDEELVREVTSLMLGQLFDEVLEAGGGRAALDLYRQHGDRIRLGVTDVVMPGMGGSEPTERLRTHAPDLPVLMISGYPEVASAPRFEADPTVRS